MDQEYSTRFYSALAPVYDWVFGPTMEPGRRIAARLAKPGDRVCELGIGTGLSLRHYPQTTYITGVDISQPMIERARRRHEKTPNAPPVELRCGDATRTGLPSGIYDIVIAPYIITTVGDPHALCREMRRLCKPGGRILVLSNTRERGIYGTLKNAISPIAQRFGFATHLDVERVMSTSGIPPHQAVRINWGIHKLFVSYAIA